jgi:Raf kinase inhibitor-like YbhB/YbcL family protein
LVNFRGIFMNTSSVPRHCLVVLLILAGLGGCAVAAPGALQLTSPAFKEGKPLPDKYARSHQNVSPPLRIQGVPATAKSLAIIMEDPDAPSQPFTHWLVWNMNPDTASLDEGALPIEAQRGKNSFGDTYYDGPAPPSGTHRYILHLYALDTFLSAPVGAKRDRIEKAMKGHIVAETALMGTYSAGH